MWVVMSFFSGASLGVEGGKIMVLYLDTLEGILKDYCALLDIVNRSCEKWEVSSPVDANMVEVARTNLGVVQDLRAAGVTEMDSP